jgi:ketosteroid isomerase-like protein
MQSNKDLIRQMWEAFTAGDRQKFFAVMADDIKFTVMGTTSLSLVTHCGVNDAAVGSQTAYIEPVNPNGSKRQTLHRARVE